MNTTVLTILAVLVNGDKELIASLDSYKGKDISTALVGSNLMNNIQKLNGNTIEYHYNKNIAKSHLLEISKTISILQPVLLFTSINGIIDNTLAVSAFERRGEFTEKFKLVLPHLSDDKIQELNNQLDKIKTVIATFNKNIRDLQPKAEFTFTLYCKDGAISKLQEQLKNE